ncbi:MAG: nucleotidyl transferase AbiEii/AbiGii toxin family protein [Bacteroidales bacterium]|nr:nucleotidyl transferase AbiEii/AbiGii toxin family protein [Bacteroidales bacterium]
MIDLKYIKSFFPEDIRENKNFSKMMLKEYIQLMILDFISTTDYAQKLVFIGDTNLRIIHGIDRFSEDLDFDCKQITNNDFMGMTDDVLHFLRRNGLNAETKDSESSQLTAFRRSFYFPQLLFDLNMTGYKDERFLIKLEAQDQGVNYTPKVVTVNKCGFVFPQQVPPDSVLCAMKISALLSRHKGRDFYDTMFLLSKTEPDYGFLKFKNGINSKSELKSAIAAMLETVDINKKKHDFEHLLFNSKKIDSISMFGDFIENL